MTTKFDTVEQALQQGIEYAGLKGSFLQLEQSKAIQNIKLPDINQFGDVIPVARAMSGINSNGNPFTIAVCEFRDGYDLWLITPDDGICLRV